MTQTTATPSTLELPQNSFRQGTVPFAEKYQTIEAYWAYSPDVTSRTPHSKGRSLNGTLGYQLSATGGEYTDSFRVNQNSLIWKVRLRTEVRKVYLDPATATTVHHAPMFLSFSADGTDFAGLEYGSSDAPNGMGIRGRCLTTSTTAFPAVAAASSLEDVGFVARVPWDDRVHMVTEKDTGYVYNAVRVAKPVAQLLFDHGEPSEPGNEREGWRFPFARNISQGGPNPGGTYGEQNADRLWNTDWHQNGIDSDSTNDYVPSMPIATEIWNLFISPLGGNIGFDPVITKAWDQKSFDQMTPFVRGLGLADFADDSIYYDIVFPRPAVGVDWDILSLDINEGINKAKASWSDINTTEVRDNSFRECIEAVADGHFFGPGLLHGIKIDNADTPNEDMVWQVAPMSIRDAVFTTLGAATALVGPSGQTANTYLANAGVAHIGSSKGLGTNRDWSTFWTDLVPSLN